MSRTSLHKRPIFLFFLLIILVVANGWLFFPRFFLDQQLLTPQKLDVQMTELAEASSDASALLQQIHVQGVSEEERDQMEALQQRVDDVLVMLQHAPYEDSMKKDVEQAVELAEVVSFTVHDIEFDLDNRLKTAKTSQILSQAAGSARALTSQASVTD